MAMAVMAWVIAVPLLGVVTGLRTFMPMAVLCWFAYRGDLPVNDHWMQWTTKLTAAVIFTILAAGELVGDKLPRTPNRTSPGPLVARLIFGCLVGAIVASALDGSVIEGACFGLGGALVGAFAGYLIRKELVQRLGCKDWHVAVAEDAIAISCSIIAMGVVTG